MSKCLVTVLIGENYQRFWNRGFRRAWELYAAKHGYDILLISDYLDPTPRARERSPHWQKCLILEHPEVREYDHAVWVDADIMINPHTAPCIVEATEPGSIGVVFESDYYPRQQDVDNIRARRLESVPSKFHQERGVTPIEQTYIDAGLPGDLPDSTNTGVMVFEPSRHADLLRHVYDHCEENVASSKENVPLSYHILKSGSVCRLDPRFNALWDNDFFQSYNFLQVTQFSDNQLLSALCVNTAWHNAYFLHFLAGSTRDFYKLVAVDYAGDDSWRFIWDRYGR